MPPSGCDLPPGSPLDDLAWLDLADASQLVQKRTVSPVDLTQACLARIEQLNPKLNAFITITAESALKEAHTAEAEIARGNWRGPLHGIPLALKDLIDTAGVRTTAGSAVLQDNTPQKDATVVQRLKEAGAVLLDKLNLHEFAYGGSGMISHFGVVKNPWDLTRVTGGSSSGSAAAVAAALCYGAIGTDTAGSIRLPAACCGIVGLKPSYGLVSARGVIPLSWTNDHVGPMTRSVASAALLLQVIASYDAQDLGSQKFPAVHFPAAIEETTIASLRLGVPREYFWASLDAEVEKAAEAALALLDKSTAGAKLVTVAGAPNGLVVGCEAFVYHQQFLGDRADKYDPETLRRIRSGAGTTAVQYVEGYRELLQQRRDILKVFDQADLLITPACPTLPPVIAELQARPEDLRPKELLMLRNTRPFNTYGLPAITVPCGFTASGLPIGLQITGAPGTEGKVMALARFYEQHTEWHKRRPAL